MNNELHEKQGRSKTVWELNEKTGILELLGHNESSLKREFYSCECPEHRNRASPNK